MKPFDRAWKIVKEEEPARFENTGEHPTLGSFEESGPLHSQPENDAFAQIRALLEQKRAEREQAESELAEQQQRMTGKVAVTPLQPAVHPDRARMNRMREAQRLKEMDANVGLEGEEE